MRRKAGCHRKVALTERTLPGAARDREHATHSARALQRQRHHRTTVNDRREQRRSLGAVGKTQHRLAHLHRKPGQRLIAGELLLDKHVGARPDGDLDDELRGVVDEQCERRGVGIGEFCRALRDHLQRILALVGEQLGADLDRR
jgi:hypothetical protein